MATRSLTLAVSILALAMLACTRSVDATPSPTELPTFTPEIANVATTCPTATPRIKTCVVVAAGGVLHFRADPNETSRVIDWLEDGEVLTVYSPAGDWLLVEYGGVLGYVKREYTKEAKCK